MSRFGYSDSESDGFQSADDGEATPSFHDQIKSKLEKQHASSKEQSSSSAQPTYGDKTSTKEEDISSGLNNLDIKVPNSETLQEDQKETAEDETSHTVPAEFDVLCLDTVKAMDEEFELKVKDFITDLEESEITKLTTQAEQHRVAGNAEVVAQRWVEAVTLYNTGLQLCPPVQARVLLYSNRAIAYDRMDQPKLALHSTNQALEQSPLFLKCLVRKANLHERLEEFDNALQAHQKVLEVQPTNAESRAALVRLPPIIEERNEKLKTEMMGKLKELGNMCLRPFGMSTDNFKFEQNAEGGGYNIKFQ